MSTLIATLATMVSYRITYREESGRDPQEIEATRRAPSAEFIEFYRRESDGTETLVEAVLREDASDQVGKRALHQAFFEPIYIDKEGVSYTRLADAFAQLLAENVKADLDEVLGSKNRAPVSQGRGSNEHVLVEGAGVEPARP